ncbi:hypothetical protein GOGPGP_GOGPGP_14845, partial [Dysosmobacter welbionis]
QAGGAGPGQCRDLRRQHGGLRHPDRGPGPGIRGLLRRSGGPDHGVRG